MERALKCLRCGADMEFLKREYFQLGVQGFSFFRTDSLDHLEAGGLLCEMYCCPKCKKLEFYLAEEGAEPYDPHRDTIREKNPFQSVICPECGRSHHVDLTECPFCKYKYPGEGTEEAPRGEETPGQTGWVFGGGNEKKRKKDRRPPWEYK